MAAVAATAASAGWDGAFARRLHNLLREEKPSQIPQARRAPPRPAEAYLTKQHGWPALEEAGQAATSGEAGVEADGAPPDSSTSQAASRASQPAGRPAVRRACHNKRARQKATGRDAKGLRSAVMSPPWPRWAPMGLIGGTHPQRVESSPEGKKREHDPGRAGM